MKNLKELIYFKKREILNIEESQQDLKVFRKQLTWNYGLIAGVFTVFTLLSKQNESISTLIYEGLYSFTGLFGMYWLMDTIIHTIHSGFKKRKIKKIQKEINVAQKELNTHYEKQLSINE